MCRAVSVPRAPSEPPEPSSDHRREPRPTRIRWPMRDAGLGASWSWLGSDRRRDCDARGRLPRAEQLVLRSAVAEVALEALAVRLEVLGRGAAEQFRHVTLRAHARRGLLEQRGDRRLVRRVAEIA